MSEVVRRTQVLLYFKGELGRFRFIYSDARFTPSLLPAEIMKFLQTDEAANLSEEERKNLTVLWRTLHESKKQAEAEVSKVQASIKPDVEGHDRIIKALEEFKKALERPPN